ncbi:MAG: hypothetical protein ND866_20475, partial [Pyrinomonadaceae bacterium]|nr:hypothetical protein [Pyrinomonadaceae bacterium]
AAVAASIEPAGQSTRVESNPQAITWERRELQGLLRPGVSTEATHENEREQSPADQVIRPAPTESGIPLQFPKVAPAQRSPGTAPIYVRVGRVEVRGTPQQEPARSTPKESTALGFASYHRMRRYRS